MNLFKFQSNASEQIAGRFWDYMLDPLMVRRTQPVPFYQNLAAITGAGKTLILADAVEQIRGRLPIEPIVLWLSKGRVVVWQTYANLSAGNRPSALWITRASPGSTHGATDVSGRASIDHIARTSSPAELPDQGRRPLSAS